MKVGAMMMAVAMALSVVGAEEKTGVPALMVPRKAFAAGPHVLMVNVGKAVSDTKLFAEAAGNIYKSLMVRCWTNETAEVSVPALCTNPDPCAAFGTNALFVVYVVHQKGLPPVVMAPGTRWAVVNVAGLDSDKPSPEQLKRRLDQVTMRGVAFAAGLGVCANKRCVTDYRLVGLADLDRGPVRYDGMTQSAVVELLGSKVRANLFPGKKKGTKK